MARYRSSSQRGSHFITADGKARLRAEYEWLWRERRPEVVRALAAAAAEGDRSENAEYAYRKKELREIDRRVRYLQSRLPALMVVDQPPSDRERVFFGACINVNQASGRCTYRIVGPDEIDPGRGYISIDSPLAQALLRHTVGDVVRVRLPAGETEFEILDIGYECPPANAIPP